KGLWGCIWASIALAGVPAVVAILLAPYLNFFLVYIPALVFWIWLLCNILPGDSKVSMAKYCTPEEGHLLAANKGKRVRIGHRFGIIEHNCWVEQPAGEKHQLSLDLQTDSSGVADADPGCAKIVARLFPELAGWGPRRTGATCLSRKVPGLSRKV